MAVLFRSSESDISFEVGEYQQISRSYPKDAAAQRPPKPDLKYVHVVLLSFGLLCVLQAALNVSLRLAPSEAPERGETEEQSCPQGWLMFSSSCYYVSPGRASWDSGRQDCVLRGADLVVINSQQEQAFLTGFTMAAWVGMTDREREGTWIWVDGTPVNKDGLLWALGQPDSAFGGEDCGDLRTMLSFIGLNDFDCNAQAQWICEKALG